MLDKIDFDPRQLGKARPNRLIWCAKNPKNLQQFKCINDKTMTKPSRRRVKVISNQQNSPSQNYLVKLIKFSFPIE